MVNSLKVFDNDFIIFSAPLNFHGSEIFTIAITDGEYNDSQTISVTINPVNDAPIATIGLSSITDEDEPIVITISGTDVDGNTLSFELDWIPINGSVTIT